MGIKGLAKFVSDARAPEYTTLGDLPITARRSFIAVDGYALYRKFGAGLDWLCVGEYGPVWHKVADFMGEFKRHGIRVVVVFDGSVDEVKVDEWKRRRLTDRKEMLKAMLALEAGALPDNYKTWKPAMFHGLTLRAAFRDHGAEVIRSIGEGDRELAKLAQSEDCLGVLSQDSDFFIFPVQRYFSADLTDFKGAKIQRLAFFRGGVLAELLELDPLELPLLATLVGNDFSGRLPRTPGTGCFARAGEIVRSLRPTPLCDVKALAVQLWPSKTASTAEALQLCLRQYSLSHVEQPERDSLMEAHYHDLIASEILPLILHHVIYLYPGPCERGRCDPVADIPAITPEVVAVLFSGRAVQTSKIVRCCLHDAEPFVIDILAPAEGQWPPIQDIWSMPQANKDAFFSRMCNVPPFAAACIPWGSLGCALLASTFAMKAKALDAPRIHACLASVIMQSGVCELHHDVVSTAPSLAAVHDCYLWAHALEKAMLHVQLVYHSGDSGERLQHVFEPWRCFSGPLTCAVLDSGSVVCKACRAVVAECMHFVCALTEQQLHTPSDEQLQFLTDIARKISEAEPKRISALGKGSQQSPKGNVGSYSSGKGCSKGYKGSNSSGKGYNGSKSSAKGCKPGRSRNSHP